MLKLKDLTQPLFAGMEVYPGDPSVTFYSHWEDGYLLSAFSLGAHSGTHIDLPLHRIGGAPSVDQTPLERFVLPCTVLDASTSRDLEAADLLPHKGLISSCPGLLLRTGWSGRYQTPGFYEEHPGISPKAARWLVEQGVTLVGMETPSVHTTLHQQVHDIFLQNNVILLETLADLTGLPSQVTLCAAPLKLQGLEASPVRAFAIWDTSLENPPFGTKGAPV
jgi:arylformamidase